MSVQEIGGKGKRSIPDYPNKRTQGHTEVFQESLMQNLKYQGRAKDDREKTELTPCRGEEKTGVGMLGSMAGIRVSAVTRMDAVQAAEVRHMNYEESDNIEIAVAEGYTLKGKWEGSHVYVEAKYDDGRLEAYRVDTGKVQEQTQHRIEQFAVETVEKCRIKLKNIYDRRGKENDRKQQVWSFLPGKREHGLRGPGDQEIQ